jgi:DNA-nicking Smr family endonuclease
VTRARRGKPQDQPVSAPVRRGCLPTDEFRAALGDVTPLPARNRASVQRIPPAPTPRQTLADEAAALAESRRDSPDAHLWEAGLEYEPEQSFLRPGLSADTLRKLRRRHWSIQAELDLHHHRVNEARVALVEFFARARQEGWRCVKVIHGKGLSSPNREPILKGKVRRWLQQRDQVLAYCEAPPVAGGAGAVLVLLKASNG